MRVYLFFTFWCLVSCIDLNAQRWQGHTLYQTGTSNTTVYLLDTNNAYTKTWNVTGGPGYSTYLMPGGKVCKTTRATSTSITGGGVTGRAQIIDWNNNILWDWTYSSANYVLHHDHCPLPNGNILFICYDVHTQAEITAIGGTTSQSTVQFEKIIEVKPTGLNTGVIVWEWRFWDHLCQTSNNGLSNYVNSAINNPQLFCMNNVTLSKDFIHANGIDYNPELDQIALSAHFLNEWFIIDHSTTTAEAATHSGGITGKGGDFLYRWGNPKNYGGTGTTIFNVLHDAHWVKRGVPREWSIVAINNTGISNPNQSTIDWAKPSMNGFLYNYTPGQNLLPITYDKRLNTNGYTSNEGNSEQFPNGNTMVCLAKAGNNQLREYDSLGNQLWQYSANTGQAHRYSDCEIDTNAVRAYFDSTTLWKPISGSLTLNVNSTRGNGIYSYQWSSYPSSTISNTSASLVVNPTYPTSYTVTVTSANCSTTATIMVRIKGFKASISTPKTSICEGDSIQLNIAELDGAPISTYSWSSIPVGFNSIIKNPVIKPIVNTQYNVTVTNDSGVVQTSINIIVNKLPAAPSISRSNDSLISTANGGNQWYKDSLILNGENKKFIIPTSKGAYSIIVTDPNNCKSTFSNPYIVSTLGIDQNSKSSFKIYPNPSNGYIYLSGELLNQEFKIELRDLTNKLIFSQKK